MSRRSLEARADVLHQRASDVIDETAVMLVEVRRQPSRADLGPWILALVALRLDAVGAVRELERLRDACAASVAPAPVAAPPRRNDRALQGVLTEMARRQRSRAWTRPGASAALRRSPASP